MKPKSGVYIFKNVYNGKVYVGSSCDIERRINDHLRALNGGYHPITYLQNSWNKYGPLGFVITIPEQCDPSECLLREQHWLDTLKPYKFENGYNRSPTAGNCLGFRHTEETKKKMSEVKRGVVMADWIKKKISNALKGKPKSEEHKANLWQNRQGWKHSEESKAKISEGILRSFLGREPANKGKKASAETRLKMSLAGRGRPKTPEHCAKISEAVKAALAKKRVAKWMKKL